jgi:hypothetical protein
MSQVRIEYFTGWHNPFWEVQYSHFFELSLVKAHSWSPSLFIARRQRTQQTRWAAERAPAGTGSMVTLTMSVTKVSHTPAKESTVSIRTLVDFVKAGEREKRCKGCEKDLYLYLWVEPSKGTLSFLPLWLSTIPTFTTIVRVEVLNTLRTASELALG